MTEALIQPRVYACINTFDIRSSDISILKRFTTGEIIAPKLLIDFANSLDPDQARQHVGPHPGLNFSTH